MKPLSLAAKWYCRTLSWLAFGLVLYRGIAWAKYVTDSGMICIIPAGYWRFTSIPLLLAAIFTISFKKWSICLALFMNSMTLAAYAFWFHQTLMFQRKKIEVYPLFGLDGAQLSDIAVLAIVIVVTAIEICCIVYRTSGGSAVSQGVSA